MDSKETARRAGEQAHVPPARNLAGPSVQQRRRETAYEPSLSEPVTAAAVTAGGTHPVLTYDLGPRLRPDARILVMKLDHLGDYIIGLPALERLRQAFPAAHIRLMVGSWNRLAAEASGLADEVVTYEYFPQNPLGWDGKPAETVAKFRELTAGPFDLAIDLRVDDDTRPLLALVQARVRCGIGARVRFPFLDVAMPPEHEDRGRHSLLERREFALGLDQFQSRMPIKRLFYHETSFAAPKLHMIYGPNVTLPLGSFTAAFHLQLTGWTRAMRRASVTLDVARDGEILAIKRFQLSALHRLTDDPAEISFTNEDVAARYEFRVFVEPGVIPATARYGGVRFYGVRLEHYGAPATARLRRAELHIGEQLSMLVQLTADRVLPLYPRFDLVRATKRTVREIVVAPLSNKPLRDWPAGHYVELIRMLLGAENCRVSLVGAPQQAAELDQIVRRTAGGARVVNLAGQTAWSDMPALLRAADLVICNNSGVAHAAAAAGAPTLAIYSASHQPQEWGPRGERSHAIMAVVPCSPCGLDDLRECPNEYTCMVGLSPAAVFDSAMHLLA